ncbi:hypothetical protein FB451DRAFT_1495648 [Mycena latifolia]|nr:hypothetical protein FB451DRAFT_1495648 [Mycena latifolia]
MSRSSPPGDSPQASVPFRKTKCKPPDKSSSKPCEHCELHGLTCEYVPVSQHGDVGPQSIPQSIPAATSSARREHRAAAPLPSTGPPALNQPSPYASQAAPDRSLASAYMAQVHPLVGSSIQAPTGARDSDSSLAGWASPLSPLRTNTAFTLQSSYTNAHRQYQSPPFSSAPVNPGYALPGHPSAFDRTSSMLPPASTYPEEYLFAPDTIAESTSMPDPSLS